MTEAPEKIYGWLNTQLSIARYYGGCTYQGHSYLIDMQDPERPLVRQDILSAEKKAKKKAANAAKAAKAVKAQDATQELFQA